MGLGNTLIYHYNVLVSGKHVETQLLGWRTALAHARYYMQDLFNPHVKVEILNTDTGEIVTVQDALKRAQSAVNSATT